MSRYDIENDIEYQIKLSKQTHYIKSLSNIILTSYQRSHYVASTFIRCCLNVLGMLGVGVASITQLRTGVTKIVKPKGANSFL